MSLFASPANLVFFGFTMLLAILTGGLYWYWIARDLHFMRAYKDLVWKKHRYHLIIWSGIAFFPLPSFILSIIDAHHEYLMMLFMLWIWYSGISLFALSIIDIRNLLTRNTREDLIHQPFYPHIKLYLRVIYIEAFLANVMLGFALYGLIVYISDIEFDSFLCIAGIIILGKLIIIRWERRIQFGFSDLALRAFKE